MNSQTTLRGKDLAYCNFKGVGDLGLKILIIKTDKLF